MVPITMWSRDDRKCQIVVSDKGLSVRLIDATRVVREQVVAPRLAASLAERWDLEDYYDAWHNSTLAVFA